MEYRRRQGAGHTPVQYLGYVPPSPHFTFSQKSTSHSCSFLQPIESPSTIWLLSHCGQKRGEELTPASFSVTTESDSVLEEVITRRASDFSAPIIHQQEDVREPTSAAHQKQLWLRLMKDSARRLIQSRLRGKLPHLTKASGELPPHNESSLSHSYRMLFAQPPVPQEAFPRLTTVRADSRHTITSSHVFPPADMSPVVIRNTASTCCALMALWIAQRVAER